MRTYLLCFLLVLAAPPTVGADAWPRFRGANGDGQSDAAGIPISWSEGDYAWKQSLPGVGHSSPVVWNERVFVTSAEPTSGEQILLAFDAATGRKLWEERFDSASHPRHATNSLATSTPAVDAQQLYVAWKSGDTVMLGAFTHEGEQAWRRPIAQLTEHHGFGTSPIVIGDVVCLSNETQDPAHSVVVGLDRHSGSELWRTPRGTGKTSFATPCVLESLEGKPMLVTASMGAGLTQYDPATGKVAWNVLAKDLPDRCVSSPILAAGLILVSCGSGNNGLHLIAVRLGVEGQSPVEAYRIKQGVPNIPTPVIADELLFLWHDRGTVTCLDAATGNLHWRERVGGKYHSSPVKLGDKILCVSLDGEAIVLAASRQYKLLGRTSLGESVTATPAAADNRLFLRSEHTLFCLGARP